MTLINYIEKQIIDTQLFKDGLTESNPDRKYYQGKLTAYRDILKTISN